MWLNLGCNGDRLKGWLNVDLPGLDADIHHDLSIFPWPFDDNSVDKILASHILEHMTREDGVKFLSECFRVLSPGGVLHIAVPDMDKFIDCHLNNDFTPLGNYLWIDLNYFAGGDSRENIDSMRHKYMYCFASLAYTLQGVGFREVEHRKTLLPFDSFAYKAISLYVDARKP